jgi:bacteriorhodopsin
MHIVAIAWIYVVLMMSITEHSVIAGIMTFVLYGVLPLTIILYLMGTPQRKRNRARAEKLLLEEAAAAKQAEDATKEKEDRRDAP